MSDNILLKILESQSRTETDIELIKNDLKEHIRRTDMLEDLHKDNAKRIELLEAPKKARIYLKSALSDIGKFAGFILTLIALGKAFNLF